MQIKVRELSHSQGLLLPYPLMERLQLTPDDLLEVTVQDDRLIMQKIAVHPQSIEELFEGIEDSPSHEPEWGEVDDDEDDV